MVLKPKTRRPRPVYVKGRKQYYIDKVIRKCWMPNRTIRYLVSWIGYGPEHNTLQTLNSIKHTKAYALACKRWGEGINPHGVYRVEDILAKKRVPGEGYMYLVHWEGYEKEESTWEPYDAVKHLYVFEKWK